MRPARETVRRSEQTYFVTSQTVERQPFFRHERWAILMQEVFQHYRGVSYLLHAYVVMPDHFHLIISPQGSLERAMQNIKGGFSFRAKRAFDWKHDIWQPGFSDHGIRDAEDWDRHIAYIHHNPVKAKLCLISEDYRYLALNLDPIPQRLKPLTLARSHGEAEAPPLQKAGTAKFTAETVPLQKPGTAKSAAGALPLQNPAASTQSLTRTEK
jgi:putative transposase